MWHRHRSSQSNKKTKRALEGGGGRVGRILKKGGTDCNLEFRTASEIFKKGSF